MVWYAVSQILLALEPFLGALLALISGVIIANLFWKSRIFRYAKAEVQQTLEFQHQKILNLEEALEKEQEENVELRRKLKRTRDLSLQIVTALDALQVRQKS